MMMRWRQKSTFGGSVLTFMVLGLTVIALPALAQPYGKGIYNANVPYGSTTSLTISTNGTVTITITPASGGTLATGTSTVTVTSKDVVGYNLYLRDTAASTALVNGANTIPASGNVSPAALAINTWGYNTDASTNFTGITASDALLKSATGPFTAGDITTVTYGVNIDLTKLPGTYSTTVMYTATDRTN